MNWSRTLEVIETTELNYRACNSNLGLIYCSWIILWKHFYLFKLTRCNFFPINRLHVFYILDSYRRFKTIIFTMTWSPNLFFRKTIFLDRIDGFIWNLLRCMSSAKIVTKFVFFSFKSFYFTYTYTTRVSVSFL